MKIIRQHLLLILIAALCCGCGGSSDDGGGTKKKGLIGYSAMSLTNPFFKIIADSITEEARLNGFDVAVNDANSDGKLQAEHIDSYIVQGAQAIILNPCDRLSVGPAIQKANKAGIPVFTCDLQCVADGVKITGHIGTDNFQGGQLAGKAMIELLGETGGKVLVLHFKQANSCVLRVDGFMKEINAHNEGRTEGRIEIAAELDGGGAKDQGFKSASAALQAHPDLAAIFAINDPSALGAYTALEQAKKVGQVKIIGFDGELAGKQAIKDGKFFADPIQFPVKMGKTSVQNIIKYLNGEEFEEKVLIPTYLYRKADADKDPELK